MAQVYKKILVKAAIVLYYSAMVALTISSNGTGSVRIGAIAFFISGLFGGIKLTNSGNLRIWLFYLPALAVLFFAIIVNYQTIWLIEFMALNIGFALTSQFRFSKWVLVSMAAVNIAFLALSTYFFSGYALLNNTTISKIQSAKPYETNVRFEILQFTVSQCGQCKPQSDFLLKYFEENQRNNIEIKCIYRPTHRIESDSAQGHEKLLPLIEMGATFIYDKNNQYCSEYEVDFFPVLVVLDHFKNEKIRINGFNGDMTYAYEKMLNDIFSGKSLDY